MSMKHDDEDRPETLKIVQLMDCDPYRRQQPDQRVVVIRLAHAGEIGEPLMLSLWDSRRLAFLLLQALATHDDPLAERLFAEWSSVRAAGGQPWREEGDPAAPPLPAPPPPEPLPKKRRPKK